MEPKLISIAGPLGVSSFLLNADEISIGRDPSNQISIEDFSVSRRHCVIKKEGEQFKILDLDSHNGIFVNYVPVSERVLENGDRIRIGNSLLVFLINEPEAAYSARDIELDDGVSLRDSTIRLRVEDALYLMARDLNTFLQISLKLNSAKGVTALQQTLLSLLLDSVPAQRSAIVLGTAGSDEHLSVFGMERGSSDNKTFPLSRTVIQEVLCEGTLILSNELFSSGKSDMAQSLISSQIQSLLCVPLILSEKITGAIYMDTSDSAVRFNKGHLQLVAAVGNIAAVALDNAQRIEWLEMHNRALQAASSLEHNLIGESASMRQVYEFLSKISPTNSTVLVTGESGTGKELVARAIHRNSDRAAKPFVAINCAALTETLLESELFGHEKGAFTGALGQKKGKIEVADGGTLFLDEVGEMSLVLQAKLLRILQEREFERVGGVRSIKVDIRVIAATNRDLTEMIKQGLFRQDLYYRLNVISLVMPPLRNRRADIPLLANYFAAKYAEKCKRRITGISPEARARLIQYHWPGNIRELENAIERAIVLGSTDQVQLEDLPESLLEIEASEAEPPRFHELVAEAKKKFIINAIEQAQGDYKEAARVLGIHPNNLYRLIKNLNLKATLSN